MGLFKSNKCGICKDRRKQRFCLRTGKDICWKCCNNLRYDGKCPAECRYALKSSEGLNISRTNADSIREYRDLVSKLMDLWMRMPLKDLGDAIPAELARDSAGKKLLTEYIVSRRWNNIFNMSYLKNKLELDDLQLSPEKRDYETVAEDYLGKLYSGDFDQALMMRSLHKEWQKELYRQDYISQIKSDPVLKKMNTYNLISSALAEDKKQALVYYDVNGRYDLSLKLQYNNDEWLVSAQVNGKLEIVNGENEALQQIAVLLSKNEMGQGEELLKKYMNIYPECSDLQYYKGVMLALRQKNEQAEKAFLRSVRLDPDFGEALYNYGLQKHLKGELELAEEYYLLAYKKDSENVKCVNNLAAVMIDQNKLAEARRYLEIGAALDPEFEPLKKNLDRLKQQN